MQSIGGHFSTFKADRGFTFGWARHTYAFPRGALPSLGEQSVGGLREYLSHPIQTKLSHQENPDASSPAEPFLAVTKRGGVAFDLNEQRTGIMLRWQERTCMLIDPSSEAVVYVSLDVNDPASSMVYVGGKLQ